MLEDARPVRISLGRLRNVGACNRSRTGELRAGVQRLREWCHRPESELARLRGKRLREAAAVFADLLRLRRDLVTHQAVLAVFQFNDFMPLAYVLREFSDRAKVIRFARNRLGKTTSKEAAMDWLIHYEQSLKEQHRVDRLVIGGPSMAATVTDIPRAKARTAAGSLESPEQFLVASQRVASEVTELLCHQLLG